MMIQPQGFSIVTAKYLSIGKKNTTTFSSEAANKLLFLLHVLYKSKIFTNIKDAKYTLVNAQCLIKQSLVGYEFNIKVNCLEILLRSIPMNV